MSELDNIDTTSAQYLQFYNGLASLRTLMRPRLAVFATLSRDKQIEWIQRDPLLRRVLRFGQEMQDFFQKHDLTW